MILIYKNYGSKFVIFKTFTKWVFETNGMYYVSPSCEFGRGNVAVYNVAVLVGFQCRLPYLWVGDEKIDKVIPKRQEIGRVTESYNSEGEVDF